MAALKKYKDNQSEKITAKAPEASGVACTEKDCKGELMIQRPAIYQENRGSRTGLKRAICGVCGWMGWV